MYVDCASADVDPDWKLDKPLTSPKFRLRMGEQMCDYSAKNRAYPGDEFLRSVTRLSKKRRTDLRTALDVADDGTKHVSYNHYLDAKHPRGTRSVSRLCGDDLDLLKAHLNSFYKTSQGKCQVCGKDVYYKCGKCDKHCCFKSELKMMSISCCLDFHSDDHFGLVAEDCASLFGELKSKFKKATATELRKNKTHMQKLKKRLAEDMAED